MHSVGQENFTWVVEHATRWLIERAEQGPEPITDYHWSTFLAGARRARQGRRGPPPEKAGRPARAFGAPPAPRQLSSGMEEPAFTLGVEEEFQIIDPETRELRSHVQEILEEGKLVLKERVKPEMHQSVIEIGTGICKNIAEVRLDVGEMRTEIIRLARKNGMRVASAGTHPFSNWADQKIFPDPRYDSVVEEMQELARANLIFGLHVHVGIQDRALAFQIMNEALYFLPHLLALSTNSPFWLGRNTGLKSFRTKVFDRFPRTSMPEHFETPAEFDEFVRILVNTNCIDNGKKIWWDVRPHPFFETIEFRVCDVPMRLDETVTLAALFQAICVKLYRLRLQNLGFRRYRRALILENKWRASRYGIDGQAHRLRQGDRGAVPRPRRRDARVRGRRRRRPRVAARGRGGTLDPGKRIGRRPAAAGLRGERRRPQGSRRLHLRGDQPRSAGRNRVLSERISVGRPGKARILEPGAKHHDVE